MLQASELRQQWRVQQGAITIALDESEVRVSDPLALDPTVTVERVNVAKSPARTMVAEMMILAGQVAATIGEHFLMTPSSLLSHTLCRSLTVGCVLITSLPLQNFTLHYWITQDVASIRVYRWACISVRVCARNGLTHLSASTS